MSIKNILKLNESGKLTKYISTKKNFVRIIKGINTEKIKKIIDELSIEFEDMDDRYLNEEIFEYIYNNSYYKVNINMVEIFLKKVFPNKIKDINKRNFTLIKESNNINVLNFINKNINIYVEKILLKLPENIYESEEAVIELLNNKNIKEEFKNKIISKQKVKIKNIENIEDDTLWKVTFSLEKVFRSWENISIYYKNYSLDNELIELLKEEYLDFEEKINAEKFGINEIDQFLISIVDCDKLNDKEFEKLIRKFPHKQYEKIDYLSRDLENLSEIRFELLISNDFVEFNSYNYNWIYKNFNDLITLYIKKNTIRFIDKYMECIINDDIITEILKDESIEEENKIHLISKLDYEPGKESSKLIYKILYKNKITVEINEETLKSIVVNLELVDEKILLLISQKDYISDSVIYQIMESLGAPYNKIKNNGTRPKIEKNLCTENLVEFLKEKGCISSYKFEGNKIRIINKK